MAVTTALCLLLAWAQATVARDAGSDPSLARATTAEPAPNAERPLTHEELLAFRGELGTRDTLLTLVAETTIKRLPPPRQAKPWRRAAAGIGTLPRYGTYPGDPVVEAVRAIRQRYTPPHGTNIEGLLAIYVTFDGMMLRGHVSTPAGAYLTPITTDAMALADALPDGTLILARGSLAVLTPDDPCPKPPPELRGKGFGGSPFSTCPAGWLTPDPVSATRADDPLTPTDFGIRVQGGARDFYWRRLDEPLAEPATYLLRRVANPLKGAKPARGWKVVGRVDSLELPAPPASLGNATPPGGLDWRAVVERQPPSDTAGYSGGGPVISTTWTGGFAAVHQGRDRVLTSWVSADGHKWRSASLPAGIYQVDALLRLGDGLAIVADSTETDWDVLDWRFGVWRSDDGLEWHQVDRHVVKTPKRFADPADGYYRIVQGYWSLGDRIVAHETYTTYRCCGRSTGTTFVAAASGRPATFAWTSRNGTDWSRARVRGLKTANGWHYRDAMHEVDGALFAFSDHPTFVIDRSTDGVRWKTIGRQPEGLDFYSPIALERTPEGLVVGGTSTGREDDGRVLPSGALWFSPDGDHWTETHRLASGYPFALAAAGDTVVAVGGPSHGTGDPGDDAPTGLLTSLDAGRTWDEELSWAADEDWCLGEMDSDGRAMVLHIGCPPLDVASKYSVRVGPGPAERETAPPDGIPSARKALACDDPGRANVTQDEWGYLSGFERPRDALKSVLREGFVIPQRGYQVLERDGASVLYGYRDRNEVKSAVHVGTNEAGAWIPRSVASCPLDEFGDAPMGRDVWMWTNRAGRAIHEIRGPQHCWRSLRFLYMPDPRGPVRPGKMRVFARDPMGELRDLWKARYRGSAALPRDARFTGYRRGDVELWIDVRGDAVYLKRGARVEQWPRIPAEVGCA